MAPQIHMTISMARIAMPTAAETLTGSRERRLVKTGASRGVTSRTAIYANLIRGSTKA